PQAGEHRVVWWDPSVLRLGVQESVGLAQQKLLTSDESGARSEQGVRAHADWQAERSRLRAQAGEPSVRVATATELAAPEGTIALQLAETVTVEDAAAPGEGVRPRGPRFGILVHAVLASVDLDADRPGVQALAELHGRLLGAGEEEVTATVDAAVRALAHPLLRRAARAGRCRREAPVTARLEDGSLMEGIVDAAFLEDGTWTVVDFKTDADVAGRLDEYRGQVALYAWAIAQATGLPARA